MNHIVKETTQLTEDQTTLTYDNGLGAYWTAPVESALRNLDCNASPAENEEIPLFGCRVVVTNWRPLAPVQENGMFRPGGTVSGRFTKIWFHYGFDTGEVGPGKARQVAAEMRAFADRLDALCDRAEEIAKDDFEASADDTPAAP